ncbi:MAG: universal stress protein [Anaerolineae bacterium]|nr:universal stress protein [Anaerolineae bacterium]
MKLLICTRCTPRAANTAEMARHIALKLADSVDVLLIPKSESSTLCSHATTLAQTLNEAGIPTRLFRHTGNITASVLSQVHTTPYDLVIISSRDRQGLMRLVQPSRALEVAEQAPVPVLVVKGKPRTIKHLLVCTAAGPTSDRPVRFAARLCKRLDAEMTLLHVMSQLPLGHDAIGADLEAMADELIARKTPEGKHLVRMLDIVAEEGTSATPLVRHGLVVPEIITSARKEHYDLIVVGAHATPGLPAFLSDDLAGRILQSAKRPVLVVR